MRYLLLFVLLIGFSMPRMASSQDPVTKFPPDSKTIFPDYITIIDEQMTQVPIDQIITVDNDKRVVRIVTDGQVDEYDYLPEFAELAESIFSNGETRLYKAIFDPDAYYEPFALYELDEETGEFKLYEPCTGTTIQGSGYATSFVHQDWVFAVNAQSEVVLCNPQNDTLSQPLPVNAIGGPNGWVSVGYAPDNNYLFLVAGSNTGGYYGFYSYNLTTQEVNSLGNVGGQSFLGWFQGWVTNTQFAFKVEASIDGRNGLYVGDITQPNSFVRTNWVEGTPTDESSFEFFGNLGTCLISQVNRQTGEPVNYDFGNKCAAIYRLIDDSYVALVASSDSTRRLMRQGATDTEPIILYEGEIEHLCSVSPDGRYAVLLTDTNGQVGEVDGDKFTPEEVEDWQLAIFDTVTQEMMHIDQTITWCTTFYRNEKVSPLSAQPNQPHYYGISWLNEETVVFKTAEGQQVLRFADGQLVEIEERDDIYGAFLNTDYLILQSGDVEDATTYQLYNVLTGEMMPLFNEDFPVDDYEVRFHSVQAVSIQVLLRDTAPSYYYITYDIELKLE